MTNESALNMLHDVVLELYERGLETQARCNEIKSTNKDPYKVGFYSDLTQAYWEVLNHIKNQAEVFGILDQIPNLAKIDPYELLG